MTNRYDRASSLCILAGIAGLAMASPALGQAPASSFSLSGSAGQPEFVDPKTGQVWTPENVGGKSGPNTPADRAFDPLAQATVVQGVVVQESAGHVPGHGADHRRPHRPSRHHREHIAQSHPRAALASRHVSEQQQRRRREPCHQLPFHQRRQSGRGYARGSASDRPGRPRGLIVYGPRTTLFVDHVSCGVIAP